MSLPSPTIVLGTESLALAAGAVLTPLWLASLVYLDARRRRSRSRSLAPVVWGTATFFSGAGCVVVAACYLAVRARQRSSAAHRNSSSNASAVS